MDVTQKARDGEPGTINVGPARADAHRRVLGVVVVDAAMLGVFIWAFFPAHLRLAVATYAPTAFVLDWLLLRRRVATAGAAQRTAPPGPSSAWLYVGSLIFLVGALGGLVTILLGGLPVASAAGLAFPVAVGWYFLRAARRQRSRRTR